VEQPGLADTKMSWARALERFERTLAQRLYLLIACQGTGPHQHRGVVMAPHRRCRFLHDGMGG
jgi:hypothetical protein